VTGMNVYYSIAAKTDRRPLTTRLATYNLELH